MNEIDVPGFASTRQRLQFLFKIGLASREVFDLLVDRFLLSVEVFGRLQAGDLFGGVGVGGIGRELALGHAELLGVLGAFFGDGRRGCGLDGRDGRYRWREQWSGQRRRCGNLAGENCRRYEREEQAAKSAENHAGPLFLDWVA